MKSITISRSMFVLSAILVAGGLLVLDYGTTNNLTFWAGVGSETYGAGLWLFALYVFGKLTKMIK